MGTALHSETVLKIVLALLSSWRLLIWNKEPENEAFVCFCNLPDFLSLG
jgi:hypothetical protein